MGVGRLKRGFIVKKDMGTCDLEAKLSFLDEPTSGLDANTANSVLRLLSG